MLSGATTSRKPSRTGKVYRQMTASRRTMKTGRLTAVDGGGTMGKPTPCHGGVRGTDDMIKLKSPRSPPYARGRQDSRQGAFSGKAVSPARHRHKRQYTRSCRAAAPRPSWPQRVSRVGMHIGKQRGHPRHTSRSAINEGTLSASMWAFKDGYHGDCLYLWPEHVA